MMRPVKEILASNDPVVIKEAINERVDFANNCLGTLYKSIAIDEICALREHLKNLQKTV